MVKISQMVMMLAVAAGLAGCLKKSEVPQGAAKPNVSASEITTPGNQTDPKPVSEQGS